jgi:hypothetical protein
MIRHCFWAFTLVCCAGLIAAAPLRAEQKATGGAACLYHSRSYSDGAFICVQKSLMLSCSSDGTRATWKIVADRDLSERCVAPNALASAPAPRRQVRRTHAIRTRVDAGVSAKCFTFNGKRYCE